MDSDPHSQRQHHIPYIQLQDQPVTHNPHSHQLISDSNQHIPSQSRQDPQHLQQGIYYGGSNLLLPFHHTASYGSQGHAFNYDKAQVLARIRTLEHRLDQGWLKCYSFWLYTLIILACADLVQTIVYAVVQENVVSFLINFVCVFWVIYQSSLEIRAMHLKDSSKAKRAVILMSIYTVLNLGAVIFYLVWYSNFDEVFNYRNSYLQARQDYVLQVSIIFCLGLAAHVFTLIGAVKVYRVLKRRDALSHHIEDSSTE